MVRNMVRNMKKKYKMLLMLFGLAAVVYGVYLFMTGFHNIDLAVNMIIYTDATTDISTHGPVEYRDLYVVGLNQIMHGFVTGLIGALFGGIIYGELEE